MICGIAVHFWQELGSETLLLLVLGDAYELKETGETCYCFLGFFKYMSNARRHVAVMVQNAETPRAWHATILICTKRNDSVLSKRMPTLGNMGKVGEIMITAR